MLTKVSDIFKLFREAISGKQQDYTQIGVNRAIVLLAVPMILEMVMESLFAVVDVFYVSKLGVDMVAVVGLTESVLMLVYSIAIGLSMAATATIARRVGEKNIPKASVAAMQAIYIGIGLAVLISISGFFFSREILGLMGASDELVAEGFGYTKWMLGGNVVIMLIFLVNAIFRGAGDAFLAMRTLWLANGLNLILDPILIFGLGPIPEFGIEGAAMATNTGRGIGVLYQLYHLFNGKGVIRLARRHFAIQWNIIVNLLRVSIGGTGQFLIASASWIFLMRIMAHFGSEALAGYTIGIRVLIFSILPAWGLANAAATLVGQNLGAQQPDRAERSVWRAAFFNMIFLGSVAIVYFLTAEFIVSIFTDEPQAAEYGTRCLQIVSLGYVSFAYGMVIAQAFNGAGDTRTPTWLNVFGFWILQLPLAYVLAITLDIGPNGVFIGIVIAETILAITSIVVFKKGKWKSVEI